MNLKNYYITVIGLGYVGLPLAVEFGKKRPVVGFDISATRISELGSAYDRTGEVSAKDLLSARFLTLIDDPKLLRSALDDEKMIFIITVPTPVDKANRPNLEPLTSACEIVGRLLKSGDVVIFESTVYPGATEEICAPILASKSGLNYLTACRDGPAESVRGSNGFFCAYSPERVNPGDKSHRLPHIRKITSGSTPEVARAVDDLYREIIVAGTYTAPSIKVAEAAKVIENAQRDLNIAFVNELSVIFNRMDIDTTEVLAAAATKWNFLSFKPGLVGGHCIGVDPYYLTHKAQELGYHPQVILAGRRINDDMGRYIAQNVIRLMIKRGLNLPDVTVGVLGVTFKENCPDVRNSKVVDMVHELKRWGIKVKIIDPLANPKDLFDEHGLELGEITPDKPVDSLIVAVAHTSFVRMSPSALRSLCPSNSRPVISDLKAIYDRRSLEALGFEVFRL